MNESQTRLTKIDPKLKENGWGTTADSYILTEVPITRGRISQTIKPRPMKADYILQYKGVKLAVVEAKSDEKPVGEGVMQAKEYAEKLKIRFTYATNGDAIYQIDMETGEEGEVDDYLSPEELWKRTFGDVDEWRDRFYAQPLYNDGQKVPRYYQEIVVHPFRELLVLKFFSGIELDILKEVLDCFASMPRVPVFGSRPIFLEECLN